MGTIRVSDDVKERLRNLKRDDESFNDLLDRLSRTEKDVAASAGFLGDIADEEFEQRVAETHEELNESLANR
jgi:predicted CopG family antitoxin